MKSGICKQDRQRDRCSDNGRSETDIQKDKNSDDGKAPHHPGKRPGKPLPEGDRLAESDFITVKPENRNSSQDQENHNSRHQVIRYRTRVKKLMVEGQTAEKADHYRQKDEKNGDCLFEICREGGKKAAYDISDIKAFFTGNGKRRAQRCSRRKNGDAADVEEDADQKPFAYGKTEPVYK